MSNQARIRAPIALLAILFAVAVQPAIANCTASMDCGECGGMSVTCSCTSSKTCSCSCFDGGCSSCGTCTKTCGTQKTTTTLKCYDDERCFGAEGIKSAANLIPKRFCGGIDDPRFAFPPSTKLTAALIVPVSWSPAQEPEISSQSLEGVPLTIADIRPNRTPGNTTFSGVSYSIHNGSSEGLVAYEIWWDFTIGAKKMRIPQIVDTWLGQPLTPGGNDSSSSFDVSVRGPDGLMPDQLVGTVAYAEFSDGTRFGPDVSTMSAYLSKARSEALEVYSKILDTYNAKGEQAVSRVLSQPMAWPANQNEKWAWVHLRERYKQQGVGSVIAEIKNRLAK